MSRSLRLVSLLACAVALSAPVEAGAAAGEPSPASARRALAEAGTALAAAPPGAAGGRRDATAALRDLALALPDLHGAERRRAHELLDRPTDPGDRDYFGSETPESPICDPHFCVHWSNRSDNAPSSRFVQWVVAATRRAYAVENGALGWRTAVPDGLRGMARGRGAEGQVDVYLANLRRGLYGFAAPDPGQHGPSRSAYLVLDRDFRGFPSPPLASLRVTVAHEYNHVLQFAYDTFEDLWMFEATATWMEQRVYPGIDDYLNYLPSFASQPQRPLTGKAKIYADSVWNHWVSSRLGPETVRDAWRHSPGVRPAHDSVAAYDRAIELHSRRRRASFSREFASFAAATAEWRASDAFPDARLYPDVRRSARLAAGITRRLRLDNTSYRLYSVRARHARGVAVRMAAERGTRCALALVARDGRPRSGSVRVALRYLPRGGRARLRLSGVQRYERVTALVINADGRGRSGRRIAENRRFAVRLAR